MPPPKPLPKRQALGRGLSALIPQGAGSAEKAAAAEQLGVRELPIDAIDASPSQARLHFDPRSLQELADSILRYGVLQPIVVRAKGDRYELVAGERRLRASKLAKQTTVPALIRNFSDDQQLEVGLIENVQRTDLNAIEEARGYLQLADTFNLNQQQIADRIGKSRPFIANKIRLLNLPEELQEMVAQSRISEGHARALLGIEDKAAMLLAAAEIVDHKLPVRDAEAIARRTQKNKANNKRKLDPNWEALRRDIESALGTTVELAKSKTGGTLTIKFFSDDQFDHILKRITRG